MDRLLSRLFEVHPEKAPASLRARLLPVVIPSVPGAAPAKKVTHSRLWWSFMRRRKLPALPSVIYLSSYPYFSLPPPAPQLVKILQEVAAKHTMNPALITSMLRSSHIVRARQEFCYRAIAETHSSYPHIARFLGGKDHTTIMYGVSAHCQLHNLPHPRDRQMDTPTLNAGRAARARKLAVERNRRYRLKKKERLRFEGVRGA